MKKYFFKTINPDSSNQQISFLVLSKTQHTVVIEAKQITSNEIKLNEFVLRIQISLDAKLAEVTSYQGEKPIPFFIHKSFSAPSHGSRNADGQQRPKSRFP